MGLTDSEDPFKRVIVEHRMLLLKTEVAGRRLKQIMLSAAYNTLLATYFMYALLVFILVFSPFLIKSENSFMLGVGAMAYNLGYLTCHQLTHRSLSLYGVQLPVCARDIGLFIGLLSGVAYATWSKRVWPVLKTFKGLLLSVIPLSVDGIAQTVYVLWESNNPVRFVTGAVLGFGVSVYLLHKVFVRAPQLREHARKRRSILASLVALIVVYSLVFNATAVDVGRAYVSEDAALDIAASASGAHKDGIEMRYLPPRTPISFLFDPYINRHMDYVVGDVRADKLKFRGVGNKVPDLPEGPDEIADLVSGRRKWADVSWTPKSIGEVIVLTNPLQNYGIWVAIVRDGSSRHNDGLVTRTGGRYYYIDAWTGTVLYSAEHSGQSAFAPVEGEGAAPALSAGNGGCALNRLA